MSTKYGAELFDDVVVDNGSETTLAVVLPEVDESELVAATWPLCEKCQAPLKSDVITICRKCGWYPSLGAYVEVDAAAEAEDETAEDAITRSQLSHLQVWLSLLPRWAWIIIASVVAVVVESIVVRLATPAEIGGLRTMWSFAQLAIGLLAFASCHIFNFVTLAADDSDVGLLDILLKPLKLWMRTSARLPERLWLVNTVACSLTAAVMSVLVIGALPYERLWDWGFDAPVKQNLMGAVLDRAKKIESRADNLEDAVKDFAGSQDLDPATGLPKAPQEKPRSKADCIILGYQLDRDGRLDTLILGSANYAKLVFAGKLKLDGMSETERSELLAKLSAIKSRTPFLAMQSDSATWVQPKYACRVTYIDKTRAGQQREMKWDRLLGTIRVN